ncbi:F-box/WD repeat-containing protein 4 [Labeo rohita]|uniref:F-box/WD repeat-containing protein 4 n=1 Tax=Labeo rohita TaxID=84645 RepID=A0ABQ8M5N4_LABRO|nr:F-box/WD repeat-containing protein 4 [Labeo rohita]
MFLFQLPEDVLFLVLSYLDPRSLCRLSQACKRSYMFISRDVVWRKIAKDIINSGLTRQGIDLCPSIPLKDRVRVLLPWIQLDCDVLYLSQAANISAYHLRAEGGKLQNKRVALFSGHQEDVCRFTLTDTHLISAGGDGKIIVHDRGSDYSVEYYGHNQEVNCIDCKGGVICLHTIPTYDRVWSVAISPSLW